MLGKKLSRYANISTPIDLNYECPVDLRPYLGSDVQPEDLGCYFALTQSQMKLDLRQNQWDLAGNIHRELHSHLGRNLPDHAQRAVADLMNTYSDFPSLKLARDCKLPFVGVSNLGKIAMSPVGSPEFQVTSFYPIGALHGTFYREENVYALVASVQSKLFLSLLHPRPDMASETANRIADDFVAELRNMPQVS